MAEDNQPTIAEREALITSLAYKLLAKAHASAREANAKLKAGQPRQTFAPLSEFLVLAEAQLFPSTPAPAAEDAPDPAPAKAKAKAADTAPASAPADPSLKPPTEAGRS